MILAQDKRWRRALNMQVERRLSVALSVLLSQDSSCIPQLVLYWLRGPHKTYVAVGFNRGPHEMNVEMGMMGDTDQK